ncbi:MAG TPA: hypothetical protein VFR02_07365, partial [bacterium]|nr:hypothetical protein [bacterium]
MNPHDHGSQRFRKQAPAPGLPAFWRDLVRGRKRLYASSLAFKTLLALVPALVLCMTLLSSDRFLEQRERLLDRLVGLVYPVDDSALDAGERRSIQRLNRTAKEGIRASIHRFAAHSAKVGMAGLGAFFLLL